MSVIIKTSEMQYKDSSGNYHGINAIAEKKIADQEAALDAKIASTQTAVNALEAQKNTIAATIASMASLGTDTTLSTPGMAADAKTVGDLKSALNHDYVSYEPLTLNLFDKNAITPNCYINYETGQYAGIGNVNYFVSDYIKVVPGIRYRLENGNQQGCYFNSDKEYVSGFVNAGVFNGVAIPSGIAYVRFTGQTSGMDSTGLFKDYVISRDIIDNRFDYKQGVVADRLKTEPVVFEKTVSTAVELFQIINSLSYLGDDGEYERCIVYISEGEYIFTYAMLNAAGFGSYGLYLPDNVDLIGLGKGAKIMLDLTGESASVQQAFSTINFNKNNNIENITFTANNCRYAAHIDNGNATPDSKETIRNCTFIHYGCSDGNWAYPTAVGEGTSSGNNIMFEDCSFISNWRAYYLHNNVNFIKPSVHVFKNCQFCVTGTGSKVAFASESMGSGVEDIIELYGCKFSGYFDSRKASGASVESCDFKMLGYGNGNIPELFYYTDGKPYTIETEYVQKIQNNTGSAIPHNTPLKCADGGYVPMTAEDSYTKFCGTAYGEIANGGIGYMRTGGYLVASAISRNLGDRIGIVDGQLAVVTNNEYIGIIKYYESVHNRSYMEYR